MPTFVEITPDPFANSFRGRTASDYTEDGSRPGSARAGALRSFDHVRRPVRGIQIKDDTYATIQVRTADGRNIPLIDAGGAIFDEKNPNVAYSLDYSNFLLQSIVEQRAEKMQIVQTFGEPYVFFFGEQPRLVAAEGILLNTEDFNWRAEFWENYDKYLRGTKCVQNMTRAILSWDDIVLEGYFVKADASESATNKNLVKVSFQILLTNYANVSQIGNSNFPTTTSAEINLNPYTLDVDPATTGGLESTTEEVRSLNPVGPTPKQNSLLQSLRNGIAKASGVVDLGGTLAPFLDLASQFVYGRNVRVPLGYAGSSVYDQETQIALASVNANDRSIILKGVAGDQVLTVPGRTRRTTPSSAYYGRFQENWDEYVEAYKAMSSGPVSPPNLFSGQKVNESEMLEKARAVFEDFGVDVDPPDAAVLAARRLTFGLMSVAVGAAMHRSDTLQGLRQVTNILL